MRERYAARMAIVRRSAAQRVFLHAAAALSICLRSCRVRRGVAPNRAAGLCTGCAMYGNAIPILRRQADHAHPLRNL
jgi:hypothetical protein